MIFANVKCTIESAIGTNENGAPLFGQKLNTKCAVVKLLASVKKTSIRTDKSASQGNAEENTSESRLLFLSTTDIKASDCVTVGKVRLQVKAVEYMYEALSGNLDHFQVDLTIWGNQ